MKFSVGDPVYIKSNDEEGSIIEIIDSNTFKVRAGNSTYHVFFEDLEHPYLRWFLNKNKDKKAGKVFIDNVRSEKPAGRQSVLLPGVYFVFFPQYKIDEFDEVIEKIKIYLYNETENEYNFNYSIKNKNDTYFEFESRLLPNSEFYIHDIPFEIAASTPVFLYKFIDFLQPALQLETQMTLKPRKLYEYLHKIKYDNHAFFYISLFEKLVPAPIVELPLHEINLNTGSAPKQNHFDFTHAMQKTKYEIDLHIEKLVSNSNKMAPSEILNIQLQEFESALELASVTHQRSIVFIHGVGKGTLKAAIHKILSDKKQTKAIKTYVNNYDTRYGYGATEVFF